MFRSFRTLFGFGKKKPSKKINKLFKPARMNFETLEDRSVPATLAAGDIAIIGYDTSGSPQDNFTILVLKDMDAGTTFFVNDNEISAAGGSTFTDLNEGEASFTVKAGQSIAAGTVINLPWGAAAVSTSTYDWTSTSGAGLGAGSDELYIYNAPSLTSTTATSFIYFGQIGSSTGNVPAGLSLGTTAFDTGSGNALRYKTSGATYTGAQSTLLSAIGNTGTNWETISAGQTTTLTPSNWTFTVTVPNTSPTLAANTGLTLNEGATAIIATANLQATDAEQGAASLTYTVATAPTNGSLKNNGVTVGAGGTFTQADIDANLITYVHNDTQTTSDSFTFTVSDGAGGSISSTTFSITVTAENDAPTLTNNVGLSGVILNNTANITASILLVTDVDNTAAQITYTVGTASTGALKKSGTTLAANDTFTQDDINNGLITYTAPASGTTDSFTFTVSDGAGGSIASTTFSITLSAGNTAPTLAVNTGLTLNEQATATIDNTKLQVTDGEQGAAGLTYTVGTAPANGSLKKSGTTLNASDTFTQADIDNSLITYVHNGSETTSDSFTFTVSDGSGGSISSTTFSITVTPQNDNPIVATNAGLTVLEGATATTIDSAKLSVSDADNTAAQVTFTVTSAPTGGTLSKNSVALAVNDTFTQEDINNGLISYAHAGGETATDNFHFTVSDGSGGSIADTTFAITVTPQNDAPTITINRTLTLNPGQSVAISNAILLAADPDSATTALVYTVTTGPTKGTITKNSVALVSNQFTQNDVNAGDTTASAVRYTATTAVAGDTDSIVVSLTDGTSTPISVTINISIVAPSAPVSFTGSYSQNFDNLLPTDPLPGANSSLPSAMVLPTGWLVSENGTNASHSIRIDSGSQSTGDSYLYGAATSNERALGTQGSGSNTPVRIGVALTNSTTTTITSLNVAYVGELWRNGVVGTNNSMTFDYSTNATSLSTGTYTAVTGLDFNAPDDTTTGIKDGNLAAFQSNVSGSISGLSWAPGSTIYLRWTDTDTTGSDDGLAIDSLTFTTGNSAPVQSANTGLAIAGLATETIGSAKLEYSDAEQGPGGLTYTLTSIPATGSLKLGATTLAINDTFTQDDINNDSLSYTAAGSTTNVSFGFSVADGQGGSASDTFLIAVTGAGNAAPTVSVNTGLTLNEGATSTIDNTKLAASDDSDSGATLVFTVGTAPANGFLQKNSVTLNANDTFTQADIDNSLITYVHSGSETTTDGFTFTVSDSQLSTTTSQTFSITVNAQNDAPVQAVNTGATVNHSQATTIGSTKLSYTDSDNTAAQVIYTVMTASTGALKNNGVALNVNDTFTQADVNNNLISYTAPASGASDSFDFSVTDGTAVPISGTFSITLAAVPAMFINEIYLNPQGNDAPNEFFELRGTPGATIPAGTYLVNIEGDAGSPNPGDIQNIFDLSGLTFGTNGLLLFLQKANTYDTTAAATAGTTIVVNSGTGAGWGNGASSSVGHSADSGATDLENASSSFLLINTTTAPALANDIDANDDGTIDGTVYSGWTVLDSVGMLDASDFGYAAINFAKTGGTPVSTTGTVVSMPGEVEYVARFVGTTGSAASDWLAADTTAITSGQPPYRFSATAENLTDPAYRGSPINTIGLPNNFTLVAPTDIALSSTSVDENLASGTVVGTFTTTDPESGDTFTYSLVSGTGADDNASFTIDVDQLKTAASFDFETKSSYSIRVRTTDALGVTFEKVFTITVNDVNEAPTAFEVTPVVTSIAENTPVSTDLLIATFAVTDDGLGTNEVELTGADAAHFTISGTSVYLKAGTSLNFEVQPSFDVSVSLYDRSISIDSFFDIFVDLDIDNLDEVAPTITSGGTATAIDENSGAGQVVYTVTSTDTGDIATGSTTYSLKPATGDFAAFSIVGSTGAVTLTGNPDFETKSSYNFTVVATDAAGNSSEQAVTLAINDLNETPTNQAPTIAAQAFTINIKSANNALVGNVVASDADAGQTLTYSMTGGNGAFTINPATGAITIANAKLLPKIVKPATSVNSELIVTVADSFSPAATAQATITVTLQAGVTMSPTVNAATFTVVENHKSNATAGQIKPIAAYGGQKFNFVGLTGADAGSFSIDAKGVIRVNVGTTLNFESKSSYSFNVVVADSVGLTKTTTSPVTINVKNLNEAPTLTLVDDLNAPVTITKGKATLTIDEQVPGGTTVNGLVIATLTAADQDQLASTLKYQMAGVKPVVFDKTGAFAYNSATGEITVADASKISFEKFKKFGLSFAVTDDAIVGDPKSKPLTTKLSIVVNVNDINEAPVISSPSTFTIAENNKAGAKVNAIKAKDADKTKQTLSFAIQSVDGVSGAGIFAIDPAKGTITVPTANALNFEAKPSYALVIGVSDGLLTTTQNLTINVLDLNEAAVAWLSDPLTSGTIPSVWSVSKATTLTNNALLANLNIADPDAATLTTGQHVVTFTDGSGGGLQFHSATGELRVLDRGKLVVGKTYTLTFTIKDLSAKALSTKLTYKLTVGA